MIGCRLDCYDDTCSRCLYTEQLAQLNAGIRVKQLKVDKADTWDTEDIVKAIQNRRIRQAELEAELKFLSEIYFNRIAVPI